MFAGVFNFLESAQRHVGVDKVRITLDKLGPLVVAWHGNGPTAQFLDRRVHVVCIALQDVRKRVVRFLDLANDDRLELAPRVLEVEVRLNMLVLYMQSRAPTYPVEVVLLVNLPLDLALYTQTDNIWVALACDSRRV